MNIDPSKQILPIYPLLCGFVRLLSVALTAYAFSIAISEFIRALAQLGWNFQSVFGIFASVYVWSRLIGFLIMAAVLWFGNKRIARWCTPKIDLRRCQVCGYDLKDTNTAQCPECGFTEPNKIDQN